MKNLIEVKADLRGATKQLSRIANVLERIAAHWGIPLTSHNTSEPDEITYQSDDTLLREEIEHMARKYATAPAAGPEEEEEES